MDEMSLEPHFHLSPKILQSISTIYTDPTRVLMEYVDNSFDSAEVYWNGETNSYSRPVNVRVRVMGGNSASGSVEIIDDCAGISNFGKVVECVGNSDKKAQAWTNGQFGYGIYSFLAVCNSLEIESKCEGGPVQSISLRREMFDVDTEQDVQLSPIRQQVDQSRPIGTRMVLRGFRKDSWKLIGVETLQQEIEQHFDQLLARPGLKVVLEGPDGQTVQCSAFDYDANETDRWEETVTELSYERGRRYKVTGSYHLRQPIRIHIGFTKTKLLSRAPVFIAKGRRIAPVKDVPSFHSKHRSDLWDNPRITGYIDLGEFLEPTLARNDFEATDKKRAVFAHLEEEVEPYLIVWIDEMAQVSESRHYKALEDRLNQALSELAKLDSLVARDDFVAGGSTPAGRSGTGRSPEDGTGSRDHGDGISGSGPGIGVMPGEGVGYGQEPGGLPGGDAGNTSLRPDEGYVDGTPEETLRKVRRPGLNIRIVDGEPFEDAVTGEQLRSVLIGDEIQIFKRHRDFESRVTETRQHEKKVSERLITYLSGEVTVHYKDRLFSRKGQPDYSKALFVEVVQFIYQMEEKLSSLAGTNLSDLE
jgi:hypothetical protein